MLNVLISGKVVVQPQARTSGNGNPFVTTTVAVADADCTASVIAFSEAARTALLALDKGDAVCLTGKATPERLAVVTTISLKGR
ncbi:MAG: single-stranded DNA-binding protein [Zoogloeaceae bacterium]|nr:single-stranded DNA-binding protein [Zoogloeaceae bacterium]